MRAAAVSGYPSTRSTATRVLCFHGKRLPRVHSLKARSTSQFTSTRSLCGSRGRNSSYVCTTRAVPRSPAETVQSAGNLSKLVRIRSESGLGRIAVLDPPLSVPDHPPHAVFEGDLWPPAQQGFGAPAARDAIGHAHRAVVLALHVCFILRQAHHQACQIPERSQHARPQVHRAGIFDIPAGEDQTIYTVVDVHEVAAL